MNFFETNCQEAVLKDALFGLCDNQNGTKAYTNINNKAIWIATVKNEKHIELVFTAIDKCVIRDNEYEGRGRCDGMLTSNDHVYFVELKDQARGWKEDAINQLESTVQFFIESHRVTLFKFKKAFACNKQHRHFQEIDNETNLRFFRNYGFRIDVQAEIIIV